MGDSVYPGSSLNGINKSKTCKNKVNGSKIKKHRRGKRKSSKSYSKHVTLVGSNAAGVRSKWTTWNKVIKETNSSLWFLQETKSKHLNRLKMENFIVYERLRDKTDGGGVAIAAISELNPTLISQGEDDVEAITIEVHAKNATILCTSAYGPQMREHINKKHQFWKYLENVVDKANMEGKGFILQGDLNAWLGPEVIPGDVHLQNDNGRLFHDFLKKYPHLTVVNSLKLCKGVITRLRKLITGKTEKSTIDFFVVCSRVLPFVISMTIDEDSKHTLTNFQNVKYGGKASETVFSRND